MIEEYLEDRWYELNTKFRLRTLNFDREEMEEFDTFEQFLSSLPVGQALRLFALGY
jgi:hypothetical protein